MYCIKLNFFINKFDRPEIYVTEKQLEDIIVMRNNPEEKDKIIEVKGSNFLFSPKDILYVNRLDDSSAFWKESAPDYYFENLDDENKS